MSIFTVCSCRRMLCFGTSNFMITFYINAPWLKNYLLFGGKEPICGRSLTVLGHRTGLTLKFHKGLSSMTWRLRVFQSHSLTTSLNFHWASLYCGHNELWNLGIFLHQAPLMLNHFRKQQSTNIYNDCHAKLLVLNAPVIMPTCSQWRWHADVYQV